MWQKYRNHLYGPARQEIRRLVAGFLFCQRIIKIPIERIHPICQYIGAVYALAYNVYGQRLEQASRARDIPPPT